MRIWEMEKIFLEKLLKYKEKRKIKWKKCCKRKWEYMRKNDTKNVKTCNDFEKKWETS